MAEKVTPERVKNLLTSFLSSVSRLNTPLSSTRTNPSQEKEKEQKGSDKGESRDVISQITKPDARDRTQFYSRVETFSPLTWFAKPLDLSPLMCARYGWENTDTDMLRCVSCRACLCGQLPKAVDTLVYRESYYKLKTNLVAAHEKLCTWSSNPSPESFMLVPYHDKVELSRAVQQCLQTLVDAQSFLPTVTYTSFMEQVETEERLKVICERIQPQLEAMVSGSLNQNSCLLALTGWSYSSGQISILHCNYCRRRIGLWNYKHPVENSCTDKNENGQEKDQNGTQNGQSDDECGEPHRKRVKLEKQSFDPIAEHRYWCPWLQTESPCLKSKTSLKDKESSASPQKSPSESSPLNSKELLLSPPHTKDGARETDTRKELPAWLIVLKCLSNIETFEISSHSFQTKMKRSPQLEGVRHLRHVLRECTSPSSSEKT